jgi:hypothetical protein
MTMNMTAALEVNKQAVARPCERTCAIVPSQEKIDANAIRGN